jgi:hypothetical protein
MTTAFPLLANVGDGELINGGAGSIADPKA